ncbi:DUF6907 domain-containing protein [Streptomyces sp. NPDC057426]|uniref:DUF6907 domain-containing protein n=1 Tax=Streptomyces sp. NPDC057426 TaxID=3346128 RepID=UPI0036BCB797
MSARDPLEGISPDRLAWHQGALDGDLAVCSEEQPDRAGYPCVRPNFFHEHHEDVLGRKWPFMPEERLFVARRAPVADGIVTLETRDYGSVSLPEPPWCTGHAATQEYRADIAHSGPEHHFAFEDDDMLVAALRQYPFSSKGSSATGLYVEQTGYARTLDPSRLRMLAAALTVHAMHLRTLADELAAIHGNEGRTS